MAKRKVVGSVLVCALFVLSSASRVEGKGGSGKGKGPGVKKHSTQARSHRGGVGTVAVSRGRPATVLAPRFKAALGRVQAKSEGGGPPPTSGRLGLAGGGRGGKLTEIFNRVASERVRFSLAKVFNKAATQSGKSTPPIVPPPTLKPRGAPSSQAPVGVGGGPSPG